MRTLSGGGRWIRTFRTGHESGAECRSVAGGSRIGEGDVGGGLHHRYRGGPSHRGLCSLRRPSFRSTPAGAGCRRSSSSPTSPKNKSGWTSRRALGAVLGCRRRPSREGAPVLDHALPRADHDKATGHSRRPAKAGSRRAGGCRERGRRCARRVRLEHIANCQPRPSASGGPSAPRAAMEPNSAKLRRAWSKARCGYHMFDCNLAGQNPLVQGARAARRRCAGGLVGC